MSFFTHLEPNQLCICVFETRVRTLRVRGRLIVCCGVIKQIFVLVPWLKLRLPRHSPDRSIFPRLHLGKKRNAPGITSGVVVLTIALEAVNICILKGM